MKVDGSPLRMVSSAVVWDRIEPKSGSDLWSPVLRLDPLGSDVVFAENTHWP